MNREILISRLFLSTACGLFFFSLPASANLIIVPAFDSSITSLSNASAIEGTINTAIGMYESTFSNPITVDITFDNTTTGLGQSAFSLFNIPYSAFRAAVAGNTKDPVEVSALANMPACSGSCLNPVTGTSQILIKSADAAALGINLGSFGFLVPGSAGTISLNTGITNVTRTGPQNPGDYDLLSVTMHEIDEILGLGSTLGLTFGDPSLQNDPSPEDFFRYTAAPGASRTFTTNSSVAAFFSVTGAVDLAEFDNLGNGDYGDWLTGATSPQVQDAIATPGAQVNWGTNEVKALQAVGFDLTIPEPSTWFLLLTGLAGCLVYRKFGKYLAG